MCLKLLHIHPIEAILLEILTIILWLVFIDVGMAAIDLLLHHILHDLVVVTLLNWLRVVFMHLLFVFCSFSPLLLLIYLLSFLPVLVGSQLLGILSGAMGLVRVHSFIQANAAQSWMSLVAIGVHIVSIEGQWALNEEVAQILVVHHLAGFCLGRYQIGLLQLLEHALVVQVLSMVGVVGAMAILFFLLCDEQLLQVLMRQLLLLMLLEWVSLSNTSHYTISIVPSISLRVVVLMNLLWKVLRNELAPGVCALLHYTITLSLDILGQLLLALLQGFQLLLLILKLHRFRGPQHSFLICSQTLISLLFLSP